jgi:predicted ribosome quality control (RQC) complex YloA/Tae2 family protein
MESNFFRFLARELAVAASGARVQRVFGPAPDVHCLELGASSGKHYMLLKAGRQAGFLFLSAQKPANPARPDAHTMWLRKWISSRRLGEMRCDWVGRRLAWRLLGPDERYLLLDVEAGLDVVSELEPGFGEEPEWPELGTVLERDQVWRAYPQLSPPLRRTLAALAEQDRAGAQALLGRLAEGRFEGAWVYHDPDEQTRPGQPLPWPLPSGLRRGRQERRFDSALEAAAFAWRPALFAGLAADLDGRVRSRLKRVKRNLRKVETERERLLQRTGARDDALALQSNLYALDPRERRGEVAVPDPEAGERRIALDPELTVAENMQRLFRQAAKAERGLESLEQRRALLQEELADLEAGRALPPPRQHEQPAPAKAGKRDKKAPGKGLDVHRFRTSDGLVALRGKNSRANDRLLGQAASPFDYWFHAEGGPGAHVVLKRDHPDQDVPPRSLEEAAALAGLKSWQAGEARARVMCALVRDVRKFKGAARGQVQVDKVQHSLLVELEEGLEDRLRLD